MARYAQKLIKLALDEPGILLEKQKFWKRIVFDEFLGEITQLLYTDGQKAFALASLAPAFAELVASESGEDPSVLLVRAYGHLGSAHFVLAEYPAADKAFDKAQEHPAADVEHADIDIRRAYLRIYQGQPKNGYALADQAVQVYHRDELLVDRHRLGLALAARGYTHYFNHRAGEATADLSAALAMINHRSKPQVFYFVLHNLSLYMLETITPDQLGQVLQNLKASYNRFVGAKRHIAKHKIRWLQALGNKRFGATRQAERLFKKAFNGFVEMEAPSEVAMISLDIALLFVEEGRFDEARALAGNTHTIVRGLGMESGATAAIKLWQNANEAELTPAFFASIRATVVEHAQPFGL